MYQLFLTLAKQSEVCVITSDTLSLILANGMNMILPDIHTHLFSLFPWKSDSKASTFFCMVKVAFFFKEKLFRNQYMDIHFTLWAYVNRSNSWHVSSICALSTLLRDSPVILRGSDVCWSQDIEWQDVGVDDSLIRLWCVANAPWEREVENRITMKREWININMDITGL